MQSVLGFSNGWSSRRNGRGRETDIRQEGCFHLRQSLCLFVSQQD